MSVPCAEYIAIDAKQIPYFYVDTTTSGGSGTLSLRSGDSPSMPFESTVAESGIASVVDKIEVLAQLEVSGETMDLLRKAVRCADARTEVDIEAWARRLADDVQDARD